MKRMWPEEFNFVLDGAEEVTLDVPANSQADGLHGGSARRKALKVCIAQQDYERIWPLAEARYRLSGRFEGYAITLIANNPHYHKWHPADGGMASDEADSGKQHATKYVTVHFLLDDVRDTATAA